MRPSPSAAAALLFLFSLFSGVLTPRLQDEPPPLLALPSSDASSSTPSSSALQAPPPSSQPVLALTPPDRRKTLALSSDEDGGFLQVDPNGIAYLKNGASKILWELNTGGPLLQSELFLSNMGNNEYFLSPDEDLNLYEFSKDIGLRELNLTVDELVQYTPLVKGSVITTGSKTTSVFIVSADEGMLLYESHLPGNLPSVLPSEEESLSLKLETTKSSNNVIIITRVDYAVNSSDLGKPLWSIRASTIRASKVGDGGNGIEEWEAPRQVDLPIVHLKKAGNRVTAMLPPASSVPNALYSEQRLHIMPKLHYSCDDGESCLTQIVSATKHNTADTSPIIESQGESNQLSKSLDISRSSSKSGSFFLAGESNIYKPRVDAIVPKFPISNNQGLLRSLQNSLEGAKAAKQDFTVIFTWLLFPTFLILFLAAFYYLKLWRQSKHTKSRSDVTVGQPLFPKKRKARKSGNLKIFDTGSNYDKHSLSEEVSEAAVDTNIQSNKEYSFLPLLRVDDSSNGRLIGRLFVSNSEIGRGSNGTLVLEGVYDGRPVAVKRLLRAHHEVASKEIQNLMASDRHPNIVRLYGVEQDFDFVYISLERCNCSLSDLVQLSSSFSSNQTITETQNSGIASNHKVQLENIKNIDKDLELWSTNGFPSAELLKLMRDVVFGLAHLHELGIIHRDLKPQNVLINNDLSLNAKLSDMGISKRLLEDMSSISHHVTGYGSSGWQAPEQLLHGRQTRAMDLFSLGCIIFFCITKGKHPFGSYFERDSNILNNRVDLFLVDHIPEAVDLLSQLLDPNPKMRPTAVEVLRHPFFWNSETRLSFLRDTSDRVEIEDRENESDLLKALEKISSIAFGGKWGEKLDAAFITDMGRYRKYKFDCTRDLLRLIRNKLNHYRELPKEIKEIFGSVPEGFDRYFSTRFPKLLIEVYKVVSIHCMKEDCFHKYFRNSLRNFTSTADTSDATKFYQNNNFICNMQSSCTEQFLIPVARTVEKIVKKKRKAFPKYYKSQFT